ncbi:MAG: response regulator [Polyangiaceae bacterium]
MPSPHAAYIEPLPAQNDSKTSDSGVRALMPPLRVLVVDDDPEVLKSTLRALSHCSATGVSSAAQAVCLLESDASFDVILSDYSMPHMSGVALLNWVQVRWPALAQRFVLFTGTRAALPRCDAALIIEKPVAALELRMAVAAIGYAARRESA